ncbi:MAG TPA: AI-2E family transporter [Thermoanaerobaculia bacterium]|nr:AI-2E family transporter [Thermoanaerobaculia bacterium]
MSRPERFSARVFALAAVAVLGYFLFRIFEPFFGAILWAALIAFLLFPVTLRVRRALKGRLGLSALVLTAGVALGLVLPAVGIALAFGGQAVDLGQRLGRVAQEYEIHTPQDLTRLPIFGRLVDWIEGHSPITAGQVQSSFLHGIQAVVQFMLTHTRSFLFGAFGVIGNIALMLFVLFFYFRDGDQIAARGIRLIPLETRKKESLRRHVQEVTRAVVFGTLVTAIVQGVLIGVAFWITGLPSPVVFGVLGTVASFVPFVGTALVMAPAVIYLFAQGVVWKWIFMLVWGFGAVGGADNFLRPALVSGRAEVGTLTAFFGVVGGLAAFGMIGLFLGPVLLALVLALLQFAEETAGEDAPAPAAPEATP